MGRPSAGGALMQDEKSLRLTITRLAHDQSEFQRQLVSILRKTAFEFDTPEALQKYLQEHPGADKTNHWVKKQEGYATVSKNSLKEGLLRSKEFDFFRVQPYKRTG